MPQLIDQPKMNEPVIFTHCFTPTSHFYLKENIVWDLLFINFVILSCWQFCQEDNIYFNPAIVVSKFHSLLYTYAPRVSLLTSQGLLLICIVAKAKRIWPSTCKCYIIQPTYLIDQDFPPSVRTVFQTNFLVLSRMFLPFFHFWWRKRCKKGLFS